MEVVPNNNSDQKAWIYQQSLPMAFDIMAR